MDLYLLTEGNMGSLPEWFDLFYVSHFIYNGSHTMYELYCDEPLLWVNRAKVAYQSVKNAQKQGK